MRLHVITCDKYVRAVLPFAWALKRYWPNHPDVVVGGFSIPPFAMPPGFTFHSIGKMEDYPVERWSDGLIKFLNEINDEVICLFLEDMWITRPVDTSVVKMAYDYMRQFEYVARLDLTGDRAGANGGNVSLYGKLGHVDLIWGDPSFQYHLSMMNGFWRKEHLLRVLIPNETPWQVELQGTPRLAALHREMIVLGTNVWPVKHTLAFRGGDISQLLLDEINPNDVQEMRKLGLFAELE